MKLPKGFFVDRLQLRNSTTSSAEIIMVAPLSLSPLRYEVYVSGPKKKNRRAHPFTFETDTLDNLEEQIEQEKAKLV